MLVIHHIDRNRNNNGRENLAILCANCHARIHKGLLSQLSDLITRRR
ncbi:MAG: HNH endonuclease [Chloroflexi bacterium]|nr:HNH endonuclease [Chloroflexota bacterium]